MSRLSESASGLVAALRDERGQSTVEAAFVIPVVFATLLVLLQPALLLYGRIIMEHAAAEGCRYMLTVDPEGAGAYVEGHLRALPDADILHASEWSVSADYDGERGTSTVRIEHGVRPLPVIGALMGGVGMTDGDGLYCQTAVCEMRMRGEWLSSDGGVGPSEWVARWEDPV